MDNMLICVLSVVAEVVFSYVCEVQRQLKQQTTEYVALTFPLEPMGFGHHSSSENPQYLLSLELVAGWFSWLDP